MATNFPTGLDSYTTKIDNVDAVMAAHVNNIQDAVSALEAKIGVNSSSVNTSVDYFLKNSAGAYRPHSHDGTSDDGPNIPGSSLTNLSTISSGAGAIPVANLPTNIPGSSLTDLSTISSGAGVIPAANLPVTSIPTGLGPLPWPTSTAPSGWLLCDGAAVSRTTYSALFAVIGTTYGVGDNSTTFNLPNMKGRIPVGYDSGQTEFDALGETGGSKTHTLSTSEMPSHSHTVTARSGNDAVSGGYSVAKTSDVDTTMTSSSVGGGNAHNNLQPYLVLNYIIKT
jgi:microcystin-dependent protein